MRRATRTFKLKVSQGGFDLLVRKTRTLLPYGTAVNVAVHHLATLEIGRLVAAVSHFPRIELIGDRHARTIFVGAPHSMADVAKDIAVRLRQVMPDWQVPELAELYLLSLQQLIDAKSEDIIAAYDRTPRLQRGG